MKRSAIAVTVCLGLSACSGQSTEDFRSLGSGRRDAAADAEPEVEEDAQVEDFDAAAQAGEDAGGDVADASETDREAGSANDAGASTSDAASAGDAGDAGNQLRIKLNYDNQNQVPVSAPLFFSYADGGVEAMRALDGQGMVLSDTAPAQFTVVLPGTHGTLNEHFELLTVLAPALGDFIEIDARGERTSSTQTIRYLASVGSLPAGAYSVSAYAGVDGCARGYQELVPAPSTAMQIGQRPDCQLETNGSVIAVMYDEPGVVLRFAGATLPAAGASPVSLTLDQWLTPEDLTLRLNNALTSSQEVALWLRKGALTVPASHPDNAPANALPFKVARSLIDSYDAAAWFSRSANNSEHLFGKNRAASAAEIGMDLNEGLPELDRSKLNTNYQALLRPSASWDVQGGSTSADALIATFSWSWQPNSDTTALLSWYFLAPPTTTSLSVPAAPSGGLDSIDALVPSDASVRFEGVEYYDSDRQTGYRDFLKERLRPATGGNLGGFRSASLLRDIPPSGNTRVVRSTNPQP